MANIVYTEQKRRRALGSSNLDTATIKCLLLEGAAALDPDHDTVAAVLAAMAELDGTGYTDGPGSAERQTVAVTVTNDDTDNQTDLAFAAATFAGVDAGTVNGYLYYEHVSDADDSLNIPILAVDTASGLPKVTNGSDVEVGASTWSF